MSEPSETSLSDLLQAARTGDPDAVDVVFPMVYDELRRLAAVVRSGRASETFDATALVHEAYLKLTRSHNLSWNDQAHFLSLAARAMRQVLVDQAAHSTALKRGGLRMDVTLSESVSTERSLSPEELLDLDQALGELAEENPRAAQVVECRFFGAMSAEETAAALEISLPTITRDWRFARAWLTRRLTA